MRCYLDQQIDQIICSQSLHHLRHGDHNNSEGGEALIWQGYKFTLNSALSCGGKCRDVAWWKITRRIQQSGVSYKRVQLLTPHQHLIRHFGIRHFGIRHFDYQGLDILGLDILTIRHSGIRHSGNDSYLKTARPIITKP